jgi:hypothetical protein
MNIQNQKTNQYILLTGHRKSGTTMLHSLFDGHPELVIYPVDIGLLYQFFPCFIKDNPPDKFDARIRTVLDQTTNAIKGKRISKSVDCFSSEDFCNILLEMFDATTLTQPHLIIDAIATAWFEYAGLDNNKPLLMKETSISIHLKDILSHLPNTQFLQIVRDPRDNFAAIKAGSKKYYQHIGEELHTSLSSLLLRARMDLMLALEYQKTFPENFMAIRFEDLTASPGDIIPKCCDFLNIHFEESLLTPTFLLEPFYGNNYDDKKFTGISDKHTGLWRDRITEFEACVIEFWLQNECSSWGYKNHYDIEKSIVHFNKYYSKVNCDTYYFDRFKHGL